jgi:hypothetical protein
MKKKATTAKHMDTVYQWASIFGIHHSTLAKYLTKAGHEPPKRNGRIPVQWVIAALKESDLKAEQTRETRERADKLELANAEKRRDLFPREEVEKIIHQRFQKVVNLFRALPTEVSSKVNPSDPDHAYQVLDEFLQGRLPELREQGEI